MRMKFNNYLATDAQRKYLQILANECFVKGVSVGYEMRLALPRMPKHEASNEISRLKGLLGKETN